MSDESFPVEKSDDEWREQLSPEQYDVLRRGGTERAFSGPLHDEKRSGVYACAGCGEPVYPSEAKFDSGTGWPSFHSPLQPDAVATREDRKLFTKRTEVHCARCGGHFGHVFDDGPPPTGQRHCINSAALTFEPRES